MSTEERIRELAYQIWESEGRPHGEESRHWEMARKLAHSEAGTTAKPAAKKRTSKPKPALTEVPPPEVTKPKASKPAKSATASSDAASTTPKKPRAPRKPATPKA